MTALYITLGAIAALFIIYWMIIFFAFRFAFVRNGAKSIALNIPEEYGAAMKSDRDRLLSADFEEVSIKSNDGLTLKADLLVGSVNKTVILFHGYRSGPTDMSGAFVKYESAGYNILLVHHRTHGKSEGKYITYGIRESEDCLLWANYADKRFGGAIFLGGISMGATTVLMAADKPLPPSVKAIAGDCGFSSPYEIISLVGRRMFHLPGFIMPMVMTSLNFYCKTLGKFSITEGSATKSLERATVPVAITHGEADDFVPCYMSEQNARACASPVSLYTVKGADHGLSHLVDPEGCFNSVKNHFEKYTNEKMF